MRRLGTKFGRAGSRKLWWLRDTLRQWTKLVDEYVRWHGGDDAPYFYNEMANVSYLASAACMTGLLALAEYGAEKERAKGGARYLGRSDLYIAQKSKLGQHASFEAKQLWIRDKPADECRSLIDDKLQEAVDSAGLGDKNCILKVGLVFVTYKADPDTDPATHVTAWESVVRSAMDCADAVAWSFPLKAEKLKAQDPFLKEYCWPGVILAMRVGKKRPSGQKVS